MNLLPQFFYGMVVIGSLSVVGDGAGVGVLGGSYRNTIGLLPVILYIVLQAVIR